MQHLPANWPALCAIAVLLGLQHGMDADHLAAIDGLTRLNARRGRRFARWCGLLFAGGHGLVVVSVAVAAGLASRSWVLPHWLQVGGSLVSIALVTLIGVANLASALRRPRSASPTPSLRWLAAERPATVALVGAVFAISFDTISQAALFALAATRFGGAAHGAAVGALFAAGMLVTDGIAGLWVSRLIARADRTSPVSARTMSLALAALSLMVAAVGVARMVLPATSEDDSDLGFGALVILLTGSSYLLACWLARRERFAAAATSRS